MKEKLEEALKKAIKKASRSPAPPKLAAAMDYAIFPGGARAVSYTHLTLPTKA